MASSPKADDSTRAAFCHRAAELFLKPSDERVA
jgi:hypothetical protein